MGRLRQHPTLGEVNRARVVRDDGTEANDGEAGELWLSNPATMRGYFRDEAATRAVLSDGWLRTGDLVRRDSSGSYTFVARKKDVLRRRGENVAAAEIEGVVAQHPAVLEAAVIGVPSDLGEDDIVLFVVTRPSLALDAEELRGLADYKVPVRVHRIDALPRTATERVAKHLLREPQNDPVV
jgi:crotonobetaine/carnitine-CoA ligase